MNTLNTLKELNFVEFCAYFYLSNRKLFDEK